MALMALLYASARFSWQLGEVHVEYREHAGAPAYPRWIGDGTVLLLLVALAQLTRMLGKLAAGQLFSASVIGSFRSFALWLLLMAGWGLVAPAVAMLVAPADDQHFRLVVDYRQLLTLGITFLLFLIARLLEHARAIDEEIREFV